MMRARPDLSSASDLSMQLHALRFALAVPLLAVACGPPPQPVDGGGSSSYAQDPPPQAEGPGPLDPNASGALPAGHPPVDATGGPAGPLPDPSTDHRWDGAVRLQGGLAQMGEGYLFVSIKHEGVSMPSYSVKLDVTDGRPDGQDLLVPFEITEANAMGGLVPGAAGIVLEAYFDPDGYVESKEGQVRDRIPVELDQSDVEITLGS